MRQYTSLVVLLVVVGALNWGMIGLTGYNFVEAVLGEGSAATRVVYLLVGLSGVWLVWHHWMGVKR